jgi:hypothetical protein
MRNDEICWSNSISEFRRSGLEGLRPFIITRRNREVAKSRSGKIVKCRNGEMILTVGSRCDLGHQIQEVNMEDHVRKDSRGPLDQKDAWQENQSTTKTPFRSFADREIQRKEVQTRNTRDHEKILTIKSPRILDR